MVHNHQKTPELYLVKAFSSTPNGGNTAGVVLYADTISRERKQKLAATLGLSETAFVSASTLGDVKVEFFTPIKQIPHCGHATVATFSLLWQKGLLQNGSAIKESIEGPRKVSFENNKVYQAQQPPRFTSLEAIGLAPQEVALALGLPADFIFEHMPVIANTGVSFLLVHLKDTLTVRKLRPEQEQIKAISDKYDLVGFYPFTTQVEDADATARMFAPSYGIPEESATGMAAGPLACYLHDFLHIDKPYFEIRQGYLMDHPSPSQIEVQLDLDEQGVITGLRAGGSGIVIRQLGMGEFRIPS